MKVSIYQAYEFLVKLFEVILQFIIYYYTFNYHTSEKTFDQIQTLTDSLELHILCH